jgi:hypothetical protein
MAIDLGIHGVYCVVAYAVFGCADMELPPDGAIVSRDGNVTSVRCIVTGQTWKLMCVGNHWSGTQPECPHMDGASGKRFNQLRTNPFSKINSDISVGRGDLK